MLYTVSPIVLMGSRCTTAEFSVSSRKGKLEGGSVRAKVEHPFWVIKRHFEFTKVRYRRLAKDAAQAKTLLALPDLWTAHRKLPGDGAMNPTR